MLSSFDTPIYTGVITAPMANLFPFSSIPLYAAAEALAYVKLVAHERSNLGFLWIFSAAVIFNAALWVFWWGYIYAYYFSPLKKFPITKVCGHASSALQRV